MAIRPAVAPPEATVDTACPLDCPDACTLSVTVRGGRITVIDGSTVNPVTGGYICSKVRHFDRRIYGEDRLHFPAVRVGAKGEGRFRRVSWNDALDTIATRFAEIRAAHGGEAILPLSYGGSNGLLTQDTTDAAFFRRLGAARLDRTVCAAPTGAANMGLYGKMPSVVYDDYEHAKVIIVWGANPSASGIHLMPYLKQARANGATLVVIDPRATTVARQADIHLAIRPGTDVAVALALHRHLFESGAADRAFLDAHTTGWEHLRERASAWTIERAAEVSGLRAADLERVARLYAAASPALIKCGWGLERNRNGGNAAAAVLALPAVGGKFCVRGGGYSMSNSGSWGITPSWREDAEPPTRLVNMNRVGRELLEPTGTPVRGLFVYNCNPAVTLPDQQRVLAGLAREDLFTVVFDQVLTDTAAFADVVLPATTFLEHYDFAKAYGSLSMHLARPVIEPVAESRPNTDVFADLLARMDLARDTDAHGRTRTDAAGDGGTARRHAGRDRRSWRRDAAVERAPDSVRGRLSAYGPMARWPSSPSTSIARRRRGCTRTSTTRARPSIRWRSSRRPPSARSVRRSANSSDRPCDSRCTRTTPPRAGWRMATTSPSRTRSARSTAP